MGSAVKTFESVVVSTRIRLARNFADYPFPARLMRDPHAQEQAAEMIRFVSSALNRIEEFKLYPMNAISEGRAAVLKERNLVSRDLIAHRLISAALVSRDESISVMVNEEDHVREQYFAKGLELRRAYERISGVDEAISAAAPIAYDEQFGYLTACPTNLGTGMRASAMLFLPAVSRRGVMRRLTPILTRKGLAVRGAFGEGSGAEGDLFQLSNEVTLGITEGEILTEVDRAVTTVVEAELLERERMKAEGGTALEDGILRSLGVLLYCRRLAFNEFMTKAADVKLGIALGLFDDGRGDEGAAERMSDFDDLITAMRPANVNLLNGSPLSAEEQDVYRAEYASKAIRAMCLA